MDLQLQVVLMTFEAQVYIHFIKLSPIIKRPQPTPLQLGNLRPRFGLVLCQGWVCGTIPCSKLVWATWWRASQLPSTSSPLSPSSPSPGLHGFSHCLMESSSTKTPITMQVSTTRSTWYVNSASVFNFLCLIYPNM